MKKRRIVYLSALFFALSEKLRYLLGILRNTLRMSARIFILCIYSIDKGRSRLLEQTLGTFLSSIRIIKFDGLKVRKLFVSAIDKNDHDQNKNIVEHTRKRRGTASHDHAHKIHRKVKDHKDQGRYETDPVRVYDHYYQAHVCK